jgi:ADP-ribose pyrophosphatase
MRLRATTDFSRVDARRYVMPDGSVSEWDIPRGGRTVATVALTDDNDVVLVRQFRPGPGRVLLELPGGIVLADEDIIQAAARELVEETGYEARQLLLVGRTWLAGYASHERHAVLATGCRWVRKPSRDPEEFGETVLLPRGDFVQHVRTGDLTDTDIAFMCLDRLAR